MRPLSDRLLRGGGGGGEGGGRRAGAGSSGLADAALRGRRRTNCAPEQRRRAMANRGALAAAAQPPSPLGRVVAPFRVDRHGGGRAREEQQPARRLLLQGDWGREGAGMEAIHHQHWPATASAAERPHACRPCVSQRQLACLTLGSPPGSWRPCWPRPSPWPPRMRAAGRPPGHRAGRSPSWNGRRGLEEEEVGEWGWLGVCEVSAR